MKPILICPCPVSSNLITQHQLKQGRSRVVCQINALYRALINQYSYLLIQLPHRNNLYNMKIIDQLKTLLAGWWAGQGYAKFPAIDDTAYNEQTEFSPDESKDSILFTQKIWHKNDTDKTATPYSGTPDSSS